MRTYDTITEALSDLKSRGYSIDFNLAFDRLICKETGIFLYPKDFEIVEDYRFEGETDPGDENIVYALESKDGNIKGVLLSAYGVYSEEIDTEMIKKLAIHRNADN
jgi:hypothetical protein